MNDDEFLKPRRCFSEPTPIVLDAAENLSAAADAILRADHNAARLHILAADTPALRQRVQSIWGKMSKEIHRIRHVENLPPALPNKGRVERRMPGAPELKLIRERDGWNCRFCGVPVIDVEIRDYFRKAYPNEFPWGRTNNSQHSGFQNLWLQHDHIVPHSRGGDNSLSNIVTTCAPCNYGRGEYLLEEMGLLNPLNFEPVKSGWDGLSRLIDLIRSSN